MERQVGRDLVGGCYGEGHPWYCFITSTVSKRLRN